MNFIVAADENYAIGNNGKLLYNIPSDLAYFKNITQNKIVIMGSKTYFSLPKHPLPNRINIVLSSKTKKLEGAIVAQDIQGLCDVLKDFNNDDIFVIGGAKVYEQLLQYCKFGYITKIYSKKNADTFIENIEKNSNWVLTNSSPIFSENDLSFQFLTFKNLNPKSLIIKKQ